MNFDNFTDDQEKNFKEMVDQCIIDFSNDEDMKEGLKQIDEWAKMAEVDIYEMFLTLYTIDEISEKFKTDKDLD